MSGNNSNERIEKPKKLSWTCVTVHGARTSLVPRDGVMVLSPADEYLLHLSVSLLRQVNSPSR
jgi:hypothetical protein